MAELERDHASDEGGERASDEARGYEAIPILMFASDAQREMCKRRKAVLGGTVCSCDRDPWEPRAA